MADIFGREALDYQHYAFAQDQGYLEGFLENQAAVYDGNAHDFDALGSRIGAQVSDFDANAQAAGYITNNLQAVQAVIEEILYTDYRLDEFIPMITDIPEGAAAYAYRVLDRTGEGRFIDNDGSNAPSASAALRQVAYPLEYAGIVPSWNFEDLRKAQFAGLPLDMETVRAGAIGALNHIEKVGLIGDTDYGFKGLTNLEGVDESDAAAPINTLSSDALLVWLQALVTPIIETSAEVLGRNIRTGLCFYLPLAQASIVTNTRMSGREISVWDYFVRHNAWFSYTGEEIQLKWVQELKGAAGSGNDRMIIALNHPRIMEMAMPISPRVIHAVAMAFSVQAPVEYKISGLNVKRSVGIRYIDIV